MAPFLAVVDDDISVRESLESLIRPAGMAVTVFGSAEEFLASAQPNKVDCPILDVRMPGMSGIELQRHLVAHECKVPIVLMTAHGYDDQARSEAVWIPSSATQLTDSSSFPRAGRALLTTSQNPQLHQGVIDRYRYRWYLKSGASMTPLLAVVDDDVSVRESLESLIRSAGMAVTVFGSAEEFLNSAQPNKPDCLILDVRMPGMSGFQLHRHLVANDCKVPVVFMTAHGYDDHARPEASSDWIVAYLNKPFSDDELLDAVHTALRLNPNS